MHKHHLAAVPAPLHERFRAAGALAKTRQPQPHPRNSHRRRTRGCPSNWESRQHIDEFSQSKLGPAFEKFGIQMDPPELTETLWIERG